MPPVEPVLAGTSVIGGPDFVAAALAVILVGTWIDTGAWWSTLLLKAGLVSLFLPLFFLLDLATPRQVAALLSRSVDRLRARAA